MLKKLLGYALFGIICVAAYNIGIAIADYKIIGPSSGEIGTFTGNKSIVGDLDVDGDLECGTAGDPCTMTVLGPFQGTAMQFSDPTGGASGRINVWGTGSWIFIAENGTDMFFRAAGASDVLSWQTSNGNPVAEILQDASLNTEGEFQVLKKPVLHGNAGTGAGEALTVAAEAITPTTGYARVTCSTGTLSTINNARNGYELWLDFVDACTIAETGNIITVSTSLATTADDVVLFRYNGTKWKQLTALVGH